ncbi:low-density lipoprotein receptor-related protein 6-like [Mytilus edulis]|uniref:low-density lipoprotein receptor-related protein 6-like n=1 Tax=Mytilus edulis TaxID=6550 RepID=UPI0039EFAF26
MGNIENTCMSKRQRLDQRAENSQRLPMNFNTERKSFFGDNTLLLISDSHTISIIDTSTLKETIVAEGNAHAFYLDFHYRKGLIFWSDYSAGTISRIRYPSNKSTTAEVIIHSQTPAGVAVDTDNDVLYWADRNLHTISRSNLDGSNTVLLVSTNRPEDIELDIANGWIYYTFNGYDAIGKIRVNGSEIQTIVDNIGTTQNLALDFYEDRIYWTENGNRIVRSAFFDGSDSKIIIDGISDGYPFGIATTKSNVYFSTWNKGELFQLFKNNASASNRLIYTTGTTSLMSIKIFQSTESECNSYVEIQNGEKRSTGYHTDLEIDIPISDDKID